MADGAKTVKPGQVVQGTPETVVVIEPAAPLNIHQRMCAINRDIEAIKKEQENKQQKFKFRGIDDVYNMLHALLATHGVYMTSQMIERWREERATSGGSVLAFTCLRIRYNFFSEDGSSNWTEAEGEGFDSGDKSTSKAMAIAHKYALIQAFSIPTQDIASDDPDRESHTGIKPREPVAQSETGSAATKTPDHVAAAQALIDSSKTIMSSKGLTVWRDSVKAKVEEIVAASAATGDYLCRKLDAREVELRAREKERAEA